MCELFIEERSALFSFLSQFLLVLSVLFLAGCGADEYSSRPFSSTTRQGGFVEEIQPPRGYYERLMASRFAASGVGRKQTREKFFLNFNGGEVSRGFSRKESFLPCTDKVFINQAGLSTVDQESIFTSVKNFFQTEKAKLGVVMEEPYNGEYSTVHIGGEFAALGCGGRELLGHAPSDLGNINAADVGFVFSANHSEPDLLTRGVIHAIGRMVGLRAVNSHHDVMGLQVSADTALTLPQQARKALQGGNVYSSPSSFYDHDYNSLPGQDFIDAVAEGLEGVGIGDEIDLTPLSGSMQDVLPADVGVPGLGRVLAAVVLLQKKESGIGSTLGDVLGSILKGSVTEVAKNPNDIPGGIAASVLDGLFGGSQDRGTEKVQKTVVMVNLPDLASLMELDRFSSADELFFPLDRHLTNVSKDFAGDDLHSLRSMLKVAYFQRLTAIYSGK